MIARAGIAALIPHAGAMCLLDEVLSWDAHGVLCRSCTHRDPEHPLRRDGELSSLHLIEYGAQAAAIHAGLLAREAAQRAKSGLLVAVRDVQLEVTRLDELADDLDVSAQRLLAHGTGWLYEFTASAGERRLGSGRVAIIGGAD